MRKCCFLPPLFALLAAAQLTAQFHFGAPTTVLQPGPASAWDSGVVTMPRVIEHGGIFYMFYGGATIAAPNRRSIGIAMSLDGRNWTKYSGNPILAPSASGFDSASVSGSNVVFDASLGQWVMFYGGYSSPSSLPPQAVGRAVAPTPVGPWTRANQPGNTPVITVGGQSDWDSGWIWCSSILQEGGQYVGFFAAGTSFLSSQRQIGRMTSSDQGLTWVKFDDPSTTAPPFANSDPVFRPSAGGWEAFGVDGPEVSRPGHSLEMVYRGVGVNGSSGLGVATSRDGISWRRSCEQQPLYRDSPTAIFPASVVRTASEFLLYFVPDVMAYTIALRTSSIDTTEFGTGCANGSSTSAPELSAIGCPRQSERVGFELATPSLAGPAGLLISTERAWLPFLNCVLYLDPATSVGLALRSAGSSAVEWTAPVSGVLVGARLVGQGFVLTPGIALSNGVEIRF